MIGEPVRERLRSLERSELIGFILVAVLLVGGAVFWYLRSLPSTVRVEAAIAASEAGASPSASPSASPGPIVVYVSGWVEKPGVYEFEEGDRIVDAIKRAGGPKNGADLNALNLAAFLTDAQQVLVMKKGQAPPAAAGSGSASGTPAGATGGPINVNTATLDQLETLPGIGPALGQRIIDHREQHGPFQSVEDLLDVSGIAEKRLADIQDQVTV
ncbi:MAG: helix-hairpin-helix domain-containing protein [Actinomycetota bacterium]|nr:helix-hairpin-helix domain-containing protein [Actinomycetota bacterium]